MVRLEMIWGDEDEEVSIKDRKNLDELEIVYKVPKWVMDMWELHSIEAIAITEARPLLKKRGGYSNYNVNKLIRMASVKVVEDE